MKLIHKDHINNKNTLKHLKFILKAILFQLLQYYNFFF